MTTAQREARTFLAQFHHRPFSISDLKKALQAQGFSLVEYSRTSNCKEVTTLLTALRLLAEPLALWLVLRPMGITPLVMGIAVTQMAMPTAVNGTLLCMACGGDSEAMAQITFMTTLGSIVTIPLVAALLL